jgi:ribosomal protein S13
MASTFPRDKRVEVGLTYLYGIGQTTATKICAATGVDPSTRVKDLTEDESPRFATTSMLTTPPRATFAAR